MYKEADDDVIELLANENITVNAHQFCIVDEVGLIFRFPYLNCLIYCLIY